MLYANCISIKNSEYTKTNSQAYQNSSLNKHLFKVQQSYQFWARFYLTLELHVTGEMVVKFTVCLR